MKLKLLFLTLLGLLAALMPAKAALIYSDSFNYADGSIVTNSSGIWVQNTGTAGSCLVSNNVLLINSARTEDIAHQLPSTYYTNGSTTALYTSFKLRCTNGLPTAFGTYFAHLAGTNTFGAMTGHRARVWAATTNNAGGVNDTSGKFYLYIVNSTGGATNAGAANQWTTALTTNATYTVVTKYVVATASSTLWINPNAETDPSVTDPTPVPHDMNASGFETNGPVNISYVDFRQATGEGSLQLDDLKVGTAFSDVAGANTSPTISAIPTQNTPASTPTSAINFTIGDDSPVDSLVLTKGSSNPTLVPTNNIVFGGSGANRTVTITPANGVQGSSDITIFVSDGVNTSSTTFTLKVGAPSIASIANAITYSNVPSGSISITLSDNESDPLTLIPTSSNPTLLPVGNISITGTGNSRTMVLTPATDQTGVATITLAVSDNYNTNSVNFVLSVSPKLGVLLSDTFSYNNFLQDTALQGADFNGTGSPWGNASGTNYDMLVINGTAQLTGARSEDLAANLAGTAFSSDSGMVFYASFSTTFSNLPTSAGDYFAHFKDGIKGTTFRAKIYASTAGAASGKFRLGLANAANNFNIQFPQDLSLYQTYQVVVRYNSGTGESVLWVNPIDQNSTSVAATDSTTVTAVQAFGLRQADTIGASYLDNLLIGTSFSDVFTSSSADVSVIKTGPAYVFAGSNISYTITVSNAGPSLASSVVVTDALPSAVTFVSATSGGVNNSGIVSWAVGDLASGAFSSLTVNAIAPASGSVTNKANAAAAISDPNLANNVSAAVITAVAPIPLAGPVLYSAGNATISWNAVAGPTYSVLWSTNVTGPYSAIATGLTASPYVDTAHPTQTTGFYQITSP